MALSTAMRLRVDDPSGVAPARRAAEQLAETLGFDEQRRGEVAIVVTELATNLVRHARGGEIILGLDRGEEPRIDAIALDRGPGIRDPRLALEDGFSTRNGAGTGLGAMGRLSATMDLHTGAAGTIIATRLGGPRAVPMVDGLVLPIEGETASGDAWGQVEHGAVVTILLADGLGHGDEAARASAIAVRELRAGLEPVALLERVHRALRPTRGAAGAVARVQLDTGALEFAGIGNISATIVNGGESRSLVSLPGILGHGVQRMRSFTYALPAEGLLVMHSDGCRSSWDLSSYPGLQRRDPLVIASLLVRDFERGNDDVGVVVARGRR
jgi:anti-sigma regulatory factor (Ser/Thr protein kinase)